MIKSDSWEEPLPLTPETVRLGFRALKKEAVELIIEKSEGFGMRVAGMRGRFQVTRLRFNPTNRIVYAASYAVATSFEGPVRLPFWRTFIFGFPQDRSWSEGESTAFINAFAWGDPSVPPHKWVAAE
jgi:hypothetical protein